MKSKNGESEDLWNIFIIVIAAFGGNIQDDSQVKG